MRFGGWSPEALDFYAGLEADNSRPYWQAHRDVYEECVKAPFLALAGEIEREFGPLHLFRPHRDVRFARDKSPYKTAQGAVTEGPGGAAYYLQVSAEGLMVACGYYQLAADQLERWRDAVVQERTGRAITAEVAALRGKGYDVGARESLKTAPRGYPRDHPRIDLLRHKGLTMGRSFPPARWLHGRGALDRIVGVWRDGRRMNRWLDRHVGPSSLPPPEPD